MKTFLFLILPLLFLIGHLSEAKAQEKQGQARIDSLLQQLPKLGEDTGKVKLLNDLSAIYGYLNPGEGIKVGNEALSLAEKLNWETGKANAMNSIGMNYEGRSDYPKALQFYFSALKIFEKTGDKTGIAASLGNIGIIYDYQSNYSKALEYYFRVVKIFEETGNRHKVAAYLGNIGVVYKNQAKYAGALEYYSRALTINEELGDKAASAINLSNIGVVYDIRAESSKALEYYFRALKLFNELGDENGKAVTLSNLAAVYLAGATGGKEPGEQPPSMLAKKDLLEKAKKYIDSAIALFKRTSDLKNLFLSFQQLSEIQSLLGDYKGALESYRNYALFKDSVFNNEKNEKIAETAMQYEFDKKQAIAKAEQDKKDAIAARTRNLQYVAIGACLLLGLFLFYGYMQKNKAKTKIENAYADLKTTQAQLIQSEKMASLGELTAGIAHEIQNPLNFVNNFSEVNNEMIDEMKEELVTGNLQLATEIADDIKQNLEKINHHGKRADAIVKGMLQHSRTSAGVKEPTDINKLADEYLRLAYHGMRAKDKSFNSDFKTDFDESIGKINVVPQDIGRVLLNLFNNAFYAVNEKFTVHRSPLTADYKPTVFIQTKKINARPDDPVGRDKIEIIVKDNGNGIPKNIIDKIFQPFYTTKPTGQGTGLGLSLAYDIIKAHGGEIKVKTQEGGGSEFIIQLPV